MIFMLENTLDNDAQNIASRYLGQLCLHVAPLVPNKMSLSTLGTGAPLVYPAES